MDSAIPLENVSQFGYISPPSIPQSPATRSLRSQSLSTTESPPNLLFQHQPPQQDFSINLASTPSHDTSAIYSHPASGVQSPAMLASFPPATVPSTASLPHIEPLGRHRGASFTSPPIVSPPRSGFDTPLTPAESLHGRGPAHLHSLPPEPSLAPGPSASELVTLSLLEAIEASVKAAREAIARGDRAGFQSKTQHVVSSADLLRGFGTPGGPQYPPPIHVHHHHPAGIASEPSSSAGFNTEGLNFDTLNIVNSHPSLLLSDAMGRTPSDPMFPTPPSLIEPSSSASSQIPHPHHSQAHLTHPIHSIQSFAHGLALLDASDPSRKRTISTATARAVEPDKAPKAQKLTTSTSSPSKSQSPPQQLLPTSAALSAADGFLQQQQQLTGPLSGNHIGSWLEFSQSQSQVPTHGQPPTFFESELAAFDGGLQPSPLPQVGVSPNTSSHPSHPPSSFRAAPPQPQPGPAYTPSPLARGGFRQSRSSSYSSVHPSLSSFGIEREHPLNRDRTESTSQASSVIPSRPHTPESTSFYLDTDREVESEMEMDDAPYGFGHGPGGSMEWDMSPSRRSGRPSRSNSHKARAAVGSVEMSPTRDKGERELRERPSHRSMPSIEASSVINLVPPPMKNEMDRVFEIYLQGVCSDLEATDSKGEPIHQTLMPKKMAKMAESDDFRPFKFRIQAFTNAFMETLAQHNLGEDIVAQKKVKAYLWHQQPLISRFNDDGKKSKSKGNHVWHIMARHARSSENPDLSSWIFRSFLRRIMGNPPPLAYVGVPWSWQPRVWDPQMAREVSPKSTRQRIDGQSTDILSLLQSIQVNWSASNIPGWLKWQDDVLLGVPGPNDATTGIEITVEAAFPAEQRDPVTTSFHLTVYSHTISQLRAPTPARDANDTFITGIASNIPQDVKPIVDVTPSNKPIIQLERQQVLNVITASIHVIAAAQSEAVPDPSSETESHALRLARQQRVLVVTAEALSAPAVDPITGSSVQLSLPSAPLMAAVATEAISHLAVPYLLHPRTSPDALASQATATVASNAPVLSEAAISDIANTFRLALNQAVSRDDVPTTELEAMMKVKALVRQQGVSMAPFQIPNSNNFMLSHSLHAQLGLAGPAPPNPPDTAANPHAMCDTVHIPMHESQS
ncbi:hypothetical protein DL93DRAFT_1962949 [Clavulina sp. PMI_390]|nr:hypothetical protein DL93DRAFT_1962949 [Clavulina sp. PMI_390]